MFSLARFNNPLSVRGDFDSIFGDIDRMFTNPVAVKGMDVWEDEEALHTAVELPGCDKDKISVTCERGVMTIKVEQDKKEDSKKYLYKSISHSEYVRTLTIPDNLDVTKAESDYKDGILTIHVPRRIVEKPRKIEVKVT